MNYFYQLKSHVGGGSRKKIITGAESMYYTLYLFTNEHFYSSYGSKGDLFDLYYLLGNHIAEETSEFALNRRILLKLISQLFFTEHAFCSILCQ